MLWISQVGRARSGWQGARSITFSCARLSWLSSAAYGLLGNALIDAALLVMVLLGAFLLSW